jgi:5-formyltetrahydrofolate cyclo-ligase
MGLELVLAKRRLRLVMRRRRAATPPEVAAAWGALAVSNLLALPECRAAGAIAAFSSFEAELPTTPLLRALLDRAKRLLLPVCLPGTEELQFRAISDLGALAPGCWGVPEPGPECPVVPVSQIDLVVVPGLAFDLKGHRLGYGGGYYDRLIAAIRGRMQAPAVGLGFELQVVEELPVGSNDRTVDILVTEAGVRRWDVE